MDAEIVTCSLFICWRYMWNQFLVLWCLFAVTVHTSLRMSFSQSHLILEICSWCCWCSTRRSPAFILSAWIMLLRASSVCFLVAFSSAISCRSLTLSWSKKRRASSLASRVSAVRTWKSEGRKKKVDQVDKGFICLFIYLSLHFSETQVSVGWNENLKICLTDIFKLTFSPLPSRMAFSAAFSLWFSWSLILAWRASSCSCCRVRFSLRAWSSFCFSSCHFARCSVSMAVWRCCSCSRTRFTSCTLSRSSLLTFRGARKEGFGYFS